MGEITILDTFVGRPRGDDATTRTQAGYSDFKVWRSALKATSMSRRAKFVVRAAAVSVS